MIYRLLIGGPDSYLEGKAYGPLVMQGVGMRYEGLLMQLGLRPPKAMARKRRSGQSRARFYFTKLGWERVGRFVAGEARRARRLFQAAERLPFVHQ